jgi:hypothetical protein
MKFDGLLYDEVVPEVYGKLYSDEMDNNLSTIETYINSNIQNNSRINANDISNINSSSSSDDSFFPLTTFKMIKNEPHAPDTEFGGFINYNQRQYILNYGNEMDKAKPLSSTFTGPPIQQDEISLNRKIRNSNNKKYIDSENESVNSFIDIPQYNLKQDFNKEHIKEYQQKYHKDYQPKYREQNKDLLAQKRSLKYQIDKEDNMKAQGIFPETVSIVNPIKEDNKISSVTNFVNKFMGIRKKETEEENKRKLQQERDDENERKVLDFKLKKQQKLKLKVIKGFKEYRGPGRPPSKIPTIKK